MNLLRSFYYMNEATRDKNLLSEIAVTLKSLKAYYHKFNGARAEEAMARAYLHASKNYNEQEGELKPYLKSLARDMMRQKESEFPEEEIESMAVDEVTSVESQALKSIVFENVNNLLIKEIVLPFMEDFLKFGALLESECDNAKAMKTYFPQGFKQVCIKIMKRVNPEEFIKSIKYIYEKYRYELQWFLEQSEFVIRGYSEADYSLLDTKKTKRIYIADSSGKEIIRPDYNSYELYIKGVIGDKTVCRVRYIDLLEQMEIMATSPISNELTEVIGKNKIVRTCGGSMLSTNENKDTICNLLLDELITNILKVSNSRLLSVGYEYVYLLQGKYSERDKIKFKGVIGFGDIELPIETVSVIKLDLEGDTESD